MRPAEINEGTILYFVDWNPRKLEYIVRIAQVHSINSGFMSKHTHLTLNYIINNSGYIKWELYNEIDLNYVNCEVYDFDDFTFITCNEQLFTELLKQLIENKRYDPALIRRVLYYD